jgi:hypothetical protein
VKKEAFKQEHMLKLQGKEYLPVAPRVVMFRQEHADWEICTEAIEVGDDFYVRAEVRNEEGCIRATAHKRVRKGMKGPAGMFPLETAETGAIGRALALCGYGTLSGDLDEGEELADAPVEKEMAGSTLETLLKKLAKVKSKSALEKIKQPLWEALKALPVDDQRRINAIEQVTAKQEELSK